MRQGKRYLDTRILTVFFLVAIPFVALGSFVVVDMARDSLETALGQSFEQRATETKLLIERYVGAQTVHSRLLALDPEVRHALAGPSPEVSAAERQDLESRWIAGDAKLTASVVGSPLAARLKEIMALRPEVRLVQVIDRSGRLVASTSRAGRAFYGDSPWFQAVQQDPLRVEPHIGSLSGRASGPALFEMANPVRDAGDGHLLGVLRTATDWSGFYGILAPVRVGRTGHALLLDPNGKVLVSDGNESSAFPGFSMLHEALQGFPLNEHADQLFGSARDQRGYWTLPEIRSGGAANTRVEPARIVGFARIDQVPEVSWIVAVEQDLREAIAPIQGVTRYLWIHFIGAFGTVILLALYFSFKTEAPVIEERLHIHEEHLPAGVHASEA
jgi:Cache domain